ncbi:MAG: 16S rRNA (cytidine(1402)-2'-O)-methyltransferase [Armatimonadetes bacterium]|nr:16S rRNA (cytidine(1402)-2'-O)-methyltransferase [Armatimonadota bacterium]NIO75521.1 16S rRNA (cytidine(1402)-2'-O)-methyltransferase [Armatimonadota bacterium]NIO95898.1 16S rRNA (cytidine(1402)-2'-O)-methyltransferase [Armatimonadota bacterium]
MPKAGRLFVVGTPLGNLEDISLRALRILKEVDLIAAEDTRVCRKILSHYSISTPVTSFHEHSRPAKLRSIISRLGAGEKVALVSNAGMPGISDPGEKLVSECIAQEIDVVAVPGPTAVITALAISGLPTDGFLFTGFLPRRGKERSRALKELAGQPRTMILFESPRRLSRTLSDLRECLGNRRAAAARELTKKFEQVIRGRLEEIAEHFSIHPPRGEITLVVEGAGKETAEEKRARRSQIDASILKQAKTHMKQGLSAKEAAREIAAATGVSRRLLYNALQKPSS